MKKLFFSLAIGVLASFTSDAQTLTVTNNTSCNAFVDFYCKDNSCTGNYVSTSGAAIAPGTHTFDAATLYTNKYGGTIPAGYVWHYGRVGQDISCPPQAPGGGCAGPMIQISDGVCVTPALSSGCVNADASCNGGCSTLNVTATFQVNGDCDIDIN